MQIRKSYIWITGLACGLVAAEGCNTPAPPPDKGLRGFHESDEWFDASNNAVFYLAHYTNEWQYNRSGPKDQRPGIGLALSGGGQRSGIFSVGILQGLQDIGVLDKVDVLSTVSGGGYAASWYYIQNLKNDFNTGDLLSNRGKYQQYLLTHGELLSRYAATTNAAQTWLVRRLAGYDSLFIETLLSIPVNGLANGVFGWHANVVPARRFYEKGINRGYDVVPDARGAQSLLDFIGFGNFSGCLNEPAHIVFTNLAPAAVAGKLPFPIVNTTAHIEAATIPEAGLLQNRVFEFTPLHYGSDYFGYQTTNYPFDYNRAISVSGAALDTKRIREPNESMFASILNYDLGFSINNPKIGWEGRNLRRLLPVPFYLFAGHYQKDCYGDRIYLADGGHSENLGAYSLVRRLCQTIIVVDAEYDPTFLFESYHLLKRALLYEMGVNFTVPEIDQGVFNSCNQTHPVMLGKISSFPLLDEPTKAIHRVELNVIYVKLSLDPKKLKAPDGYDPVVANYYSNTRNVTQIDGSSEFPQESTFDLSYNPEQVLAYHNLGRYIITNNANMFPGLATR